VSTDLASNIRARKEAEEVVDMCGNQPQRFWEALRSMCEARLPPEPTPVDPYPPMDDKEAANFERREMPYGKYVGKAMGEIPVSYMCWLVEGDAMVKAARRYVRSKRFSERQDQEAPVEYGDEA